MKSEKETQFQVVNDIADVGSRRIGSIICIVLVVMVCFLPGCTGRDPYQNMAPEDAAFLRATEDLPFGAWDANSLAEMTSNYDEMYRIAQEQKEIDERRIQTLRSMPVSEGFQDIKDEFLLSDESSASASDYEMTRVLFLKESNETMAEYYWGLEDKAMEESIDHLNHAEEMVRERYGF
jgi:hypothetical protein